MSRRITELEMSSKKYNSTKFLLTKTKGQYIEAELDVNIIRIRIDIRQLNVKRYI